MKTTQTYARIAGALVLISMVAGGFGESYVPARLFATGDAAATARNLTAFEWLLRLGVASYLVEATCDVSLALLFYALLRATNRDLALLSAFFGLVGTAVFAVGEVFLLAAPIMLGDSGYLKPFSPGQLNSLVLVWARFYGLFGGVSIAFYGAATALRGYLIFRSGYLPRFVGVLLAIGGLAFVVDAFTMVLAPGYAAGWLLALLLPGGLSLMLWLLIKGIDVQKWEAKAAAGTI